MNHKISGNRLLIIILAFYLILVGCSDASDINFNVNLIQNPGNEEPLVNGKIPYWEEVSGTNWGRNAEVPVYEGNAYFDAGEAGQYAELKQIIDVSGFARSIDDGQQRFVIKAYMRSYPLQAFVPVDGAQLGISFFNADGELLDQMISDQYFVTDRWGEFTDTLLAPEGTRSVGVHLGSIKYGGFDSDGYFDGLSLIALPDGDIETIGQPLDDGLSTEILEPSENTDFNTISIGKFMINYPSYLRVDATNILGVSTLTITNIPEGIDILIPGGFSASIALGTLRENRTVADVLINVTRQLFTGSYLLEEPLILSDVDTYSINNLPTARVDLHFTEQEQSIGMMIVQLNETQYAQVLLTTPIGELELPTTLLESIIATIRDN